MDERSLAKKIRDEVFGPCTSMYECLDIDEIAADLKRDGVTKFIDTQLTVESVMLERMLWGIEDRKHFEEVKEEVVNTQTTLKKRVEAFKESLKGAA